MATRVAKRKFWESYKDDDLLELRFCDLDLNITNSRVEPFIQQLYKELAKKNLKFKPHVWISAEWFSPDGVPGLAIPFFLIHDRLMKLEKKMVFEVEGGSDTTMMRLLRHEAGHAIDNGYRLRKSRKRQNVFGLSSTPYPDEYSPRAYSRKYVVNLDSWYAQAHPDEDWAETFAVWLNPKSNWKRRYKNWPALEKLLMVDELMGSISGRRPFVQNNEKPSDITKSRLKLKTFYRQRREKLGLDAPFYLDPLLIRLFSADSSFQKNKTASSFIRQERKFICRQVGRWTGQYQYTINSMLEEMITSCQEKKLRLKTSERQTRIDLIGMLTAQTMNYLMSGHHKVPM